jgi:hypothetical protein
MRPTTSAIFFLIGTRWGTGGKWAYRGAGLLLAAGLVGPPCAWAGKKEAPPPLTKETIHPSGAFAFRVPEVWRVDALPGRTGSLQAEGDGLFVRFLYESSEVGFDGLHVTCMLERLAGSALDSEPQVQYEYDFLSGVMGERKLLDSAYVVTYDAPVLGYRQWRQRTLTVVGAGESLCVTTFAPAAVWKKSHATRNLLDAIVGTIAFR